jgi:beta-N-acetylhexosaminidase
MPEATLGAAAHDHYAVHSDTMFYDPNDGCASNSTPDTSSSSAQGSDNEMKIWNWLVGKGFTGAEAAGIMGNIQQESGFDPTIIQGGGNSNNPSDAGGGGWGLVQWTPGAKVLLDVKGAGVTGPVYDIASELQIAYWEAQGNGQWAGGGNTIAKIKAVSGNDNNAAETVANIWLNDFEHAKAGPTVGPRGAYADQILAYAKAHNWPNAGDTNSSGSSGGSSGSTGSSGSNGSSGNDACCPNAAAATNGTFTSLSGDQAISGTFVLGFDANTNKSAIEAVFKKYKPAGIYVLNTTDAAAAGFTKPFFDALAVDAGHPIITASDEEGLFKRYKYNYSSQFPDFPNAGVMSTMNDTQVTNIAQNVAKQLVGWGINTDLAPVVDIGTGNNSDFHQQPGRTFGTNYVTVTTKAQDFANGLTAGGINPVFKHFPGLGSSTGNTDSGSVTSPPLSQLEATDLLPYPQLLQQTQTGTGSGVMLDNAHVPGLTAPGTVASTSPAAVSLLRNKYGFSGLVMTDDLIATGVGLPPDQALAQALAAGVDAPLEKYTSDGTLDSAIAKAKALKVNTQNALSLLDAFVPSPSKTGTETCATAPGIATCSGTLVNPFPDGWAPNRLDMGYDGTFTNKIVSPMNGTVQFAGPTTGWQGSLMVVIKAPCNVGLPNSQSLYFTEGVKPTVKTGQAVKAGDTIATAVSNPYNNIVGNIEWGVADGSAKQGVQPNTEALILGINGNCAPSAAAKNMMLAFYAWAQKITKGKTTDATCAGAP